MLFITILSQNILGLVTGRHSLLVGDIIIEEHFKSLLSALRSYPKSWQFTLRRSTQIEIIIQSVLNLGQNKCSLIFFNLCYEYTSTNKMLTFIGNEWQFTLRKSTPIEIKIQSAQNLGQNKCSLIFFNSCYEYIHQHYLYDVNFSR